MHSSILEPINTYIRSRQRQFTELLRQIITIPSPTGQEGEKAAWVLASALLIGMYYYIVKIDIKKIFRGRSPESNGLGEVQ